MRYDYKFFGTFELRGWRLTLPPDYRVVATNGCFDLLHIGHTELLHHARSLGDCLVVGLNSDESVRQLKGAGRPLNSQMDRARVVAALQAVDFVYIFDQVRATDFLRLVRPHVWVKGGDYTLDTLDPAEVAAVQEAGGTVKIVPMIPGVSTTQILSRMRSQNPELFHVEQMAGAPA